MFNEAAIQVAHPCTHRRRGQSIRFHPTPFGWMLAGALMCWLTVTAAWGAASPRDLAREAQIEQELGREHPELVATLRAARVAFEQENYAEAARLLGEITAKAPDSEVGLRRLGACLVRLGKRAEGLELCERAVALRPSSENLITLAYSIVLNRSRNEHRADYVRALELLRKIRALPAGDDLDALTLTAQVALALNEREEFQATRVRLAVKYPNEVATHYFAAVAAALEEEWLRAEAEIKLAGKLGLPPGAVQSFLAQGVHSHAVWSRTLRGGWLILAVWIGGLLLLFALGFLLSHLTLRQVQPADAGSAATSGERLIRKCYRVVLNVAGVYYYISLPIVVLLVVGIVAAILYACLMIGRIPIKLMLLLGIGALVTIVALLKSLFIRVKPSDPGRALARSEAEGLWQLTEEVAQSVGTRPIDEIRITPGTELAVYERGDWRQKLRNQAHRILILGTGVLSGFKQDDFRCVLAHEYGHFNHRDTAGGDIALRVRSDMIKFYLAMREAGQATYINVAFHFLRAYDFIFRRISHGATRLQEILADRVAAQIYGAPAFERGLTHVIRRSLEFEAAANLEIQQSLESRRPLQNLYELPAPSHAEVAVQFDKALNRATTADDTHPSPRDRFRLVAPLQTPACPPRPGEVWDLFNDPDALRREMVALIESRVAPHRAQPAAAAEPAQPE